MTTKIFDDRRVWRKSSRSSDQGGACVFAAVVNGQAGLRDSKQGANGPQLWVGKNDFAALLANLKLERRPA